MRKLGVYKQSPWVIVLQECNSPVSSTHHLGRKSMSQRENPQAQEWRVGRWKWVARDKPSSIRTTQPLGRGLPTPALAEGAPQVEPAPHPPFPQRAPAPLCSLWESLSIRVRQDKPSSGPGVWMRVSGFPGTLGVAAFVGAGWCWGSHCSRND